MDSNEDPSLSGLRSLSKDKLIYLAVWKKNVTYFHMIDGRVNGLFFP